MKQLTIHDVIARLKNAQGDQSLREFAAELKTSASVISRVYSGDREPPASIINRIGVKKNVRRVVEFTAEK